jgi:hypothetical protein
VIGLVSESLRNLLEAEMGNGAKVTLLSPGDDTTHTTRVNLFLYRVQPNAHLNNRDWATSPATPGRVMGPPIALNLYYLLTPYAPLDPNVGLADAQAVMAEAIRVLNDFAVVPGDRLEAGLQEGEVKVTLHGADLEELSKVWTALNEEMRLSAVYEVSYVEIRSARDRPIPARVQRTEVEVETGRRPELVSMAPRSGPAGTVVTFAGVALGGRSARVVIGGQTVGGLTAPLTSEREFAVTVPTGLAPGTYEVVADVEGLAGLTTSFEVTP